MTQTRQECSGMDLSFIYLFGGKKHNILREHFPGVPRSIQLMELSGFKPAHPKNLRGL